jgi:transposase
MAGEF